MIAGVIPTELFVEAFRDLVGNMDPALCDSSTFDSIAAQLRQISDILQDGTQDPAEPCDAISVGVGFRGTLVTLGTPEPPTPVPDPCP